MKRTKDTQEKSYLVLYSADVWNALPSEVQALAQPYVKQQDTAGVQCWIPESVDAQLMPYVLDYARRGGAATEDGAL